MAITPNRGVVEPYSQLELTFLCQTKAMENAKGLICNLMSEDSNVPVTPGFDRNASYDRETATDYYYTASFTFGEIDYKLPLKLQARAVLPNIRINTQYVNFGSCAVNDRKDYELKIENLNNEAPVDFRFKTVS